jgi:hypothetical protein
VTAHPHANFSPRKFIEYVPLPCWLGWCALLALLWQPLEAGEFTVPGSSPGGELFGEKIQVLPNGNFVVVDSRFDIPGAANAGRVYLFSASGALLSTLTGGRTDDQVGSGNVTVLKNGNFVVRSPLWNNPSPNAAKAGAVTWGNQNTGFIGGINVTVSAANSLVGTTLDDQVGSAFIQPLPNGHYVVVSHLWNNGSALNAGAVTRGNGDTGTVGAVTAANSLVGSTTDDNVGSVTVLSNGHYVVASPSWSKPAPLVSNVGAVTWCHNDGRTVGALSATNSLVGVSQDDLVGELGVIFELANGNFVVRSPNWNNGSSNVNAGAVTWCNGNGGTVGNVSASNSLVGSRTGDTVGIGGVTALANGNYVVCSQNWSNPAISSPATNFAGAATWGNGNGGTVGAVSTANSLVGTTPEDLVGSSVIPLTSGNYVVCSPAWDSPGAEDAGAATWGNGNGDTVGAVGLGNSLVGPRENDAVGSNATPLTNGHYVVSSTSWSDGDIFFAGAATWCNGNVPTTGAVTPANSLIGSAVVDRVGNRVEALPNGNYLVRTPDWDNGDELDAGAVTWGNGNTGVAGKVSPANSLVGTREDDRVGEGNTLILTNGNYVVRSPEWANNGEKKAGAATWGNGTTGIVGAVSPSNSLVGTLQDDKVGLQGLRLALNGNYVVGSPDWDNGSIRDAGAATWGNGATGVRGPVTPANSLVGTSQDDDVGAVSSLLFFLDGNYGVRVAGWDISGGTADVGAVTFGQGSRGTVGPITAANSSIGSATTTGIPVVANDAARDRMLFARAGTNLVTVFTPGAGSIALTSKLFTVTEASGFAAITLVRSGGTEGAAQVRLRVTAGTATASTTLAGPGDFFTPAGNSVTVNFADGEPSRVVNIAILPGNAANEENETFTVTLSDPVDIALGAITSATVRIIDAGDAATPSAPSITFPAAGARVGVNAGGTITITGSATDNRGIGSVEVSLNGGTFVPATLLSVTGRNTTWSAAVTPRAGSNTVQVRSFDTTNVVPSPSASRTFVVLRPLAVEKLGNGSFTAGFSPTSFREVGKPVTVTAAAAAGFLFDSWIVTGPPNSIQRMGVSPDALRRNTITFVFQEGLRLTANFRSNPFSSQVAGTFNGPVTASRTVPNRGAPTFNAFEDGTAPTFATEGAFRATVLGTGGFSGTLTMDDLVLNIAGSFDADGVARFGTNRTPFLSVPRAGKTSLTVELRMTTTPLTAAIIGTATQRDHPLAEPVVSDVIGDRASFDGTTVLVPPELLGDANANGLFTLFLSAKPANQQPAGILASEFPPGTGFALVTVTKAGAVSVSGLLSDGKPLTASTTLSQSRAWHLFARPYGGKGLVAAQVVHNLFIPDTDMQATRAMWFRPIQDLQHYPRGWPDGLFCTLGATKYETTPGSSIIEDLSAPDADGNAELAFEAGQLLAPPLAKKVNITTTDAVTNITAPVTSYTLSINRTTGRISGTFTHDRDNAVIPFHGIVLQKGNNSGAAGFFLTKPPPVKDYTGEGGAVSLVPQ